MAASNVVANQNLQIGKQIMSWGYALGSKMISRATQLEDECLPHLLRADNDVKGWGEHMPGNEALLQSFDKETCYI